MKVAYTTYTSRLGVLRPTPTVPEVRARFKKWRTASADPSSTDRSHSDEVIGVPALPRHPSRGLPNREFDVHLSDLKAQTTTRGKTAISLKGAGVYRRIIGGWSRLHPVRLPEDINLLERFDTREALGGHVHALNDVCKRLYQQDLQQKAQNEADRIDRERRKKAARREYKQWLNTLPLSADEYKEDPDRFINTGAGPQRARPISVTRWMHRKAHEKWPDEARNVSEEIRGKYGLSRGVMLV